MLLNLFKSTFFSPASDSRYRGSRKNLHIDGTLFSLILILCAAGLIILYSASGQSMRTIEFQIGHFLFGFMIMFMCAQISPMTWQRSAIWLYGAGLIMLVVVLLIGHIGKGGQRWLNLGIVRFQPAELMKLAIPLTIAYYYHKITLPVRMSAVFIAVPLILIPAALTAKQPDLGTAILLFIAGASVLFLAGLSGKIMASIASFIALLGPFAWYFLYDYQRQRVLTFLNPERDPLGKGYHIIQSKIAIGSGGVFGKGWLHGTQSNLHFLPEHTTDFIFAVCGEEFGFVGSVILITLYMLIIFRGFYITVNAQNTFSRLLAGSLTCTLFISFFINMGMVTGILPVVGIPLPLVSYGGSSMVTIMASFGILMSIQTHRRLVTT